MKTRIHYRGFTVVELLVVLAVVAILLSIFWPQHHGHEKARLTKCKSNQMQLGKALAIYVQEHKGQLPGTSWGTDLDISDAVMICPGDSGYAAGDSSYGYNGLLINADGTGIMEKQILAATEVAAFADATPALARTAGGIFGGNYQLDATRTVSVATRHDKGTVVGFYDGHTKYYGESKDLNMRNANSPLTRAFNTAQPLGIVTNAGGGVEKQVTPLTIAPKDQTAVTIGGEYCTRPLLTTMGALWKASKGQATEGSFLGANAYTAMKDDFVWGSAVPMGSAPPATINRVPVVSQKIAVDALVIIVAKDSKCTINGKHFKDGITAITPDELKKALEQGRGSGDDIFQAYSYDTYSGTGAWMKSLTRYAMTADTGKTLPVAHDIDMVDKVATDANGIGYCSAAFVDPTRVVALPVSGWNGVAATCYFPYNKQLGLTDSQRWEFPTVTPTPTAWPLMRDIYISRKASRHTGSPAFLNAWNSSLSTVITQGPLFKASYFQVK